MLGAELGPFDPQFQPASDYEFNQRIGWWPGAKTDEHARQPG